METPARFCPGRSTRCSAHACYTQQDREKTRRHIFSQKVYLEPEPDSQSYLPAEGTERIKGKKRKGGGGLERKRKKSQNNTHKAVKAEKIILVLAGEA